MTTPAESMLQASFTPLLNLAAERLGARALAASDEFFAPKENLLKPGRGVFIADKYTEFGKWMDGWESRRKRVAGHDWCLIKLGLAGIVRGVDVDTNHFTGNFPEFASLDACVAAPDATAEQLAAASTAWTEIVPVSRLQGGSQNLFAVADARRWTHLRLNIYPDGGVARLRVHGEVVPDWKQARVVGGLVDLAAVENGGVVALANDAFFGPKDNLILPGPSLNMGDGWETRRKRGPGNDWIVVRLGAAGTLKRIEVDTKHFKGNYPDRCSLEGARLAHDVPAEFLASRTVAWHHVVPPVKLNADSLHTFEKEIVSGGPFTHVRLSIFPDGGVARLRLWGTVAEGGG